MVWKFEILAVPIYQWNAELRVLDAFFNDTLTQDNESAIPVEKLSALVGKLKVELDFL
jgi:hypothetical protein